MTHWRIRHRPGTDLARRFPTTSYPWSSDGYDTPEDAEQIRAACPNAASMEVYEVGDDE